MINISSKMVRIVASLAFFAHTSSVSVRAGWFDTLKDSFSEYMRVSKKSTAITLCCLGTTYLIGRFLWHKYRSYNDKKNSDSSIFTLQESHPSNFSDRNDCQKLLINKNYCDALATHPSQNLVAYSSNTLYSKESTVTIAHFKQDILTTEYICPQFRARSLAFHPTQPVLAMGGFKSNTIVLWLYEQKKYIRINAHSDSIEKLCWNQDGSLLASASNDGSAKVWSVDKNITLKHTITPDPLIIDDQKNWINTLAFSADGTYLAIDGKNSGITLWRMKNNDVTPITIHKIPESDRISEKTFSSLAFHPSHNNQLVIAGHDFIALYTIDTHEYTYIFKSSTSFLSPKITFSKTGNYLGLVTHNLDTHYLGIVDLQKRKARLSPVTMDKTLPTWSACSFAPDETSLIWSSNFTEPLANKSMGKRTFQLSSWKNPFLNY